MAFPPAEAVVDATLARRLLEDQQPDLADLELTLVGEGWDNVTFRLGPDLALRLPRRAVAGSVIEHEQRWLPVIAPRVPIAVPVPLRTGAPVPPYPWAWSVVPWIEGHPSDLTPPAVGESGALGRFLSALHGVSSVGAPHNPFRTPPLAGHAQVFEERMTEIRRHRAAAPSEIASLATLWEGSIALEGPESLTLVHGDLHGQNVLVENDRIAGVIDWGDLTAGDPATDLAAVWALFPPEAHAAAREAYGPVDPTIWGRARGWAIHFGVMLLAHGLDDDHRFVAAGRQTLERVLAG